MFKVMRRLYLFSFRTWPPLTLIYLFCLC